ncbi:MAG: type II toxin-antitoxin system RelE/ParE family toxin [Deltaproteobacteria bacterium]|nr:type II toxin-antitoxin system RelE/ParE family toxin [Deltaproteobacteria bacterium]MBN2674502.1 type II toxin-antitoxin system RelE/ParE family toxin [Deltaproteobacteria bacterium]
MARLIWTEPALHDFEEIAEYIALDDVSAATRLVKKVFDVVEKLEDHPESGRRPPELKRTQYREKIVGPCRVFYRVEKESVYVLCIMRGERQLRDFILSEREKLR